MPSHESIRVLIVDDEGLAVIMLEMMLKNLGFNVAGKAADGQQAVDLAASVQPDVILMDLGLPEMDGFEATRRIQEHCPTPVVIVTGYYKTPQLATRAQEVGASGWVNKPVSIPELQKAILAAIEQFNTKL